MGTLEVVRGKGSKNPIGGGTGEGVNFLRKLPFFQKKSTVVLVPMYYREYFLFIFALFSKP